MSVNPRDGSYNVPDTHVGPGAFRPDRSTDLGKRSGPRKFEGGSNDNPLTDGDRELWQGDFKERLR